MIVNAADMPHANLNTSFDEGKRSARDLLYASLIYKRNDSKPRLAIIGIIMQKAFRPIPWYNAAREHGMKPNRALGVLDTVAEVRINVSC